MKISIQKINEKSQFFNDVIELGDKNSDTLGFFPEKAFVESAKHGNILGAIIDGTTLAGYLLYRVVKSKGKASVTHLCVAQEFRKNGIGRKLVEELKIQTSNLFGIGLYCRRDYESNTFWKNVGFRFEGEKPGRGKDATKLTYYWYDFGRPSLFDYKSGISSESKPFVAVLDANKFIGLFENNLHPLNADWIREDISFFITPELNNEIQRDDVENRRLKMLEYSKTFSMTKYGRTEFEEIEQRITEFFSVNLSQRDISDIKQLSHAISSKADFFVTNDHYLQKIKKPINEIFGLSIISPDGLIIHFDEAVNKAAYQISRLAGSSIQINRVKSGQVDSLAGIFHRYTKDNKSNFQNKINNFLSLPKENNCYVVYAQDLTPLALFVHSVKNKQILDVPLFVIINDKLTKILASQLLFWSVQQAVLGNFSAIQISDNNLSEDARTALIENSFILINSIWKKILIIGVLTTKEVENSINLLKEKGIVDSTFANKIFFKLRKIRTPSHMDLLFNLEKILWPAKIIDSNLPAFIVPINPSWAIDLFDYKLGDSSLFGSNPTLMFRMNNAYYRSANTHYPSAPSRVLWYVSKNKNFQDVMAIRACSYVEEVIIGFPKDLFKRFSKMGVFDWENIKQIAGYDLQKKLLAFVFSRTEVFTIPIPLKELELITNKRSAPQSPWKISNGVFCEIYKKGQESSEMQR